jgi:predicted ABC-type ATPase
VCFIRNFFKIEIISKRIIVDLVYLFLDSSELCIERIEARVAKGGHFVPPRDVHRRFYRSYQNFDLYKKMASNWALYYNLQEQCEIVAAGESEKMEVLSLDLFKKFQAIKEGNEQIKFRSLRSECKILENS